jgi:hypothetical protein
MCLLVFHAFLYVVLMQLWRVRDVTYARICLPSSVMASKAAKKAAKKAAAASTPADGRAPSVTDLSDPTMKILEFKLILPRFRILYSPAFRQRVMWTAQELLEKYEAKGIGELCLQCIPGRTDCFEIYGSTRHVVDHPLFDYAKQGGWPSIEGLADAVYQMIQSGITQPTQDPDNSMPELASESA